MTLTKRTWALVLIAALVILNGVVLGLLMGSEDGAAPSAQASSTASPPESVPTPVPTPEPEGDPTTAEPRMAAAVVAARQIVALDADVAWRSTLASCGQGTAILERTLDGGASWSTTNLDLESVVRLRASDANSAFVVGVGQGCETALSSTTDGGETWTRADANLSSAWFLAPTDRTLVVGPRATSPVPCPSGVVDLAALDVQRGAVLCLDGSLAVSSDGGQSWATTLSVAGARAITTNGAAYAVATYEGPCNALSLYGVNSDGEAETAPFACVPVASAVDVALSISDDLLWVWSGTDLAISLDGGQTW